MFKFPSWFLMAFILSLTLLKGCTAFGESILKNDIIKDEIPDDVTKLIIDVCPACKKLVIPELPKLISLTIQNGSKLKEVELSTLNSNHLKGIVFNNCNGLTIEPEQIPFSVPIQNLVIKNCLALSNFKRAVLEYRQSFEQVAQALGAVRYKTKNESMVLLFSALLPEIMHCLYGQNGYQQVIARWSCSNLSGTCVPSD